LVQVAETGKERQRRRTRTAIVAATAELLAAGVQPSVNEIADAAGVSRRTVYLYFPTLEQLMLDATVGLLSQAAVDEAIDAVDDTSGAASAERRVEAMVRALADQAAQTLPLGRNLIRLTVAGPASGTAAGGGQGAADGSRQPQRGYRRVAWIERALEPLRPQLDDAAYERLVSGLAMVVGWEALVVLADIRGLSPAEQANTSLWAARALIEAAIRPAQP
jgi:AcrR family transcriptional regulator